MPHWTFRKWTSDMGPELAKAKEELSRAISEERLTTWGAPRPQRLRSQFPPIYSEIGISW